MKLLILFTPLHHPSGLGAHLSLDPLLAVQFLDLFSSVDTDCYLSEMLNKLKTECSVEEVGKVGKSFNLVR